MNALDEYLESKQAGAADQIGNIAKNLGQRMASGVGGAIEAGAAAAIAAGAAVAAKSIYDAATKARDFKSMMQANPDLHDHYQADPKFFSLAFNTLRVMRPEFSQSPLVAGTYVRQMVENPLSAGGIAVQALGAGKDIKHPVSEAYMSSAKKPREERKEAPPGASGHVVNAPAQHFARRPPREEGPVDISEHINKMRQAKSSYDDYTRKVQ